MRGWSFTIITIILSSIILLVVKDLLANFIVTRTLKDRQIAWLCPPASKLLGAPRSRLHLPSLRPWFCGSTK
jgi:hypothetical protein